MTPGKDYAQAIDGGDPVVVVAGLTDHTWGMIGSFAASNSWTTEVDMAIEGDYAVAKNVTLANGNEFKFRADDAWTLSYGAGCEVNVGEVYTTYNNGGNMKFVGEDGAYDIYFSMVDASFYMEAHSDAPADTKGVYTSMDFFKPKQHDTNKSYAEQVKVNGTAYSALKLGTSSVVGSFTTNAIGVSGNKKLSFYALGWNGKTSKLKVTVDGKDCGTLTLKANAGIANNSPYTVTTLSDDTDYYTIELTGVSDTATIKFETLSGATRCVIFGVNVY
jgi:hypothetical protein